MNSESHGDLGSQSHYYLSPSAFYVKNCFNNESILKLEIGEYFLV